jgi:hypothetical protein
VILPANSLENPTDVDVKKQRYYRHYTKLQTKSTTMKKKFNSEYAKCSPSGMLHEHKHATLFCYEVIHSFFSRKTLNFKTYSYKITIMLVYVCVFFMWFFSFITMYVPVVYMYILLNSYNILYGNMISILFVQERLLLP